MLLAPLRPFWGFSDVVMLTDHDTATYFAPPLGAFPHSTCYWGDCSRTSFKTPWSCITTYQDQGVRFHKCETKHP